MKEQIISLNKNTWMIQEETVRFFLLAGNERVLLIDSGGEIHHAKETVKKLTSLPYILANTHTDGDHTGSNQEFDLVYMNPAEYMYYRKTQKHGNTKLRPIWDGEVIELGNRPIQVITIPGHTPGSTAFLDIKNRFLFSGDPVQDGTIYMFGEQRDVAAYEESLKKLDRMSDRFDWIFPCHGSSRVKPEIIKELLNGVAKMRKGLISPKEAVYLDTNVKEYDLGPAVFLYDDWVTFPE
ncbi:MBL fold metallo-hydrolase [Dorea sp. OM02-2LB]|nr:MBL fold metallo-hydrolase [Dorea sp. OM02-2LB]